MSLPPVPPGFDLTASQAPSVIASTIVLLIIGTIGVGLRFYARRKSGVQLWLDDWLVIFAWVPFVIICGANFFGVKYGAGRHMIWVLQNHPDHMEQFLKYIYAVEILYSFVVGPIKCSICFLYIRIFGVFDWFRYGNYALITITTMWGLATLLGSIFQCTPVKEAWNPLGDRSTCIDLQKFLMGTNAANAVLDFLILLAPIYPIWQLHLPTRKKILILVVMLLGASETAFSVVRLIKLATLGTTDMTWDYVTPIIWSTVEPSIGLLCACVPVMGALLPKSWMETMSGNRSRNAYYGSKNKGSSHALSSISHRSTFNKLGASGSAQPDDLVTGFDDDDDNSQRGIRQTTTFSVETGVPRKDGFR